MVKCFIASAFYRRLCLTTVEVISQAKIFLFRCFSQKKFELRPGVQISVELINVKEPLNKGLFSFLQKNLSF